MEWYSFRKRKLNVVAPIIYYFTPYNKNTIGADFFYAHMLERGWQHELVLKENYDRAGEFLFKKLLRDKDIIKDLLKKSRKIGKGFLDFCRSELSDDLSRHSNKELIMLLERYYSFYEDFSVANVPPWLFLADKLSCHLLEKLSTFAKKDTGIVFALLSAPNALSYTKNEELEVLSLAIAIKEKGLAGFEDIPELNKLVKSYFWIYFDYLGPEVLDKVHYIKKIKELLHLDKGALEHKRNEILEYQKNLLVKQKNAAKELRLPTGLVSLFEALKCIAILQDEKKAITTESHYYLQQLYKEFAARSGMEYLDFYFLLKEEIKDIMLNSKNMGKIAKEREKLSITLINNGKVEVLHGNEAKKYAAKNNILLPSQEAEEEAAEIKGAVGSPGYAVGKARVIEAQKDMHLFKQGEILVAPMTTPDYVQIMSKAKAIITDEGGMTCHAAIVSRELGIPCIIGTRIATKVIKDGDIVEVDANKGIVKIIKNK